MTVTPRELAHAAELRSALAELNNAAIDARPYLASHKIAHELRDMLEVAAESGRHLDRLNAAIADAGEVLERCSE